MGCLPSKYDNIYVLVKSTSRYRSEFEALQFTEREIGKMYRMYMRIDADRCIPIAFMGAEL